MPTDPTTPRDIAVATLPDEFATAGLSMDQLEILRRRVEDAITDALTAAGHLNEWRPIESAPKDGTHILVGFFDGGTGFGYFNGQLVAMQTVAHWFGPADLPGLRSGGWYPSVQTNDGNDRLCPTHWQPLSKPPGDST